MGEHLAHGVTVQTEDTGSLPDAHAVYYAGSSDAQIQFHSVHPSHLPWGRVVPYGRWRTVQFSTAVRPAIEPPTRYIIAPPFTLFYYACSPATCKYQRSVRKRRRKYSITDLNLQVFNELIGIGPCLYSLDDNPNGNNKPLRCGQILSMNAALHRTFNSVL